MSKLIRLCPTCLQPVDFYYGPWCPRCEKPQIKLEPTLNLIKVLKHIEALGHPDFKSRMWDGFTRRHNYIKGNDTLFEIFFPDVDEFGDYEEYEGTWAEDLLLIKSTFDLGESIIFEVSW